MNERLLENQIPNEFQVPYMLDWNGVRKTPMRVYALACYSTSEVMAGELQEKMGVNTSLPGLDIISAEVDRRLKDTFHSWRAL